MTSITKRILFNSQSVKILNGFYNSKSCIKCIRQIHLLKNQNAFGSSVTNLMSIQKSCNALSPLVTTSIRFKSNKRNRRAKGQDNKDEEENDNDDVDDRSGLNEFKIGDKSDRNLAQIKIGTLRVDAIIKVGLGIPRSKTEKLFYDSKIRIDGQKITKKSMDILKECEIDVITGTSPDNDAFLVVNRIEILSVKADGLYYLMTIRRSKNLTIENYESGGRLSE